jgi:cysteine desulfurase
VYNAKVYLDHNATTALEPRVEEYIRSISLMPYNASSIHYFGREGRRIIEDARLKIASSLNIDLNKYKVIFTSGGTEANNLALLGIKHLTIAISSIEHPSILNVAKNFLGHIIPVNHDGIVEIELLDNALKNTNEPVLVSIMLANNETGVIQDIKRIAEIVHKYNGIIHTDAIQAYGKITINMDDLNVDMLTISGHKCGAPQGVGALIVRKKINLEGILKGGGQEQSIRPGTENVFAIAGLGKAAEYIGERIQLMHRVEIMRNWLEEELLNIAPELTIFSNNAPRLPNTSYIEMPGVSSELQLINFDLNGIAVSAGSACSSGKISVSHVLTAIGVDSAKANCAIRVSLGTQTTKEDIAKFIEVWKKFFIQNSRKCNDSN